MFWSTIFGHYKMLKLCTCVQADAGIGGAVSQALNPLTQGRVAHLHVDGGQISNIPLHTKSQPQRHTLKNKISPDFTLAPSASPVNAFPSSSLLTASLWNNTKTQCRINPAVCSFSPERTKTGKKGPNPTVEKRWGAAGQRGEAFGRAEAGGDG